MTEAQNYPVRQLRQHRFQTFAVMTLVGGAVMGAGYEATGGPESIRNYIDNAKETSFGLSNIDINAGKNDGKSIIIGAAASSCIDAVAYSVDGVYKFHENPDEYKVKVQKIGQGAIDAIKVESCILKATGEQVQLTITHS
jgi:hypothetical protein